MQNKSKPRGFTLLCDSNGIVKKILNDNSGLSLLQPLGKLFYNFVERNTRHKTLNFFLEIKSNKIAYDYKIDLLINNKIETFVFIGVMIEDEILIIAAGNQSEVIDFVNQLQEINNEQANAIRFLLKNQTVSANNPSAEDNKLYDDISRLNNELVNLQRELNRKNAELERLNLLKNKFLGMAAHDLRNPLGVILSYSEFLIDETTDILSDEHKKFLKIIFDSSDFMLRIIEDLLDISKIESGKIDLNMEMFNVSEFLKRIISLNAVLSAKKSIEINFESIENDVFVNADASKLEQVFNNLISNAIKFSLPNTKIRVSLNKTNVNVIIGIHDQGQGIPEKELEKLFKPFQKTTVKSTAGEKSTGLGLSISKRIVEAHKGKINVESKVGYGSVFYVSLPA